MVWVWSLGLTCAAASASQIVMRRLLGKAVGVGVFGAGSGLTVCVGGICVAHTALGARRRRKLLCGGDVARGSGWKGLVVTVACVTGWSWRR